MQLKKEATMEKKYLCQRLEHIFSSVGESPASIQAHWFFYSKDQKLFFTFDNGVFTHPKLSSYVHAVLWLEEKEKMMMCALSPLSNEEEISYTFPLLDQIEMLHFSFYSSHDRCWHNDWPQEKQEVPAFVKITYNRDQKIEEHIFDLKKTITIKR